MEKPLILRKAEGRRGRGDQRKDGITESMDMSLSKLQEMVKDREVCVLQSMGSQRVRHHLVTKQKGMKCQGSRRGEVDENESL